MIMPTATAGPSAKKETVKPVVKDTEEPDKEEEKDQKKSSGSKKSGGGKKK